MGGRLGGAAHRDERHRWIGGPAARPGGRGRETHGHTHRAGRPPSRLAPAVPRRRGERACQCIFELHGRRSPRDGRLAPAARWHARARARSQMRPSAPAGTSALAARQLPGSRRRSDERHPICTWWAIHAAAARRPRGTGSILGMNSRATQRAGEFAAADPAYRARLARRLQLAARSRPKKLPRAAPFGFGLERAIAHGGLRGRGVVRCAVRRLCDAQKTTPSANTRARRHPVFNTLMCRFSCWSLSPSMGLKDAVRVGAVRGLTVQRCPLPCVARRMRNSCQCNSHFSGV